MNLTYSSSPDEEEPKAAASDIFSGQQQKTPEAGKGASDQPHEHTAERSTSPKTTQEASGSHLLRDDHSPQHQFAAILARAGPKPQGSKDWIAPYKKSV